MLLHTWHLVEDLRRIFLLVRTHAAAAAEDLKAWRAACRSHARHAGHRNTAVDDWLRGAVRELVTSLGTMTYREGQLFGAVRWVEHQSAHYIERRTWRTEGLLILRMNDVGFATRRLLGPISTHWLWRQQLSTSTATRRGRID